MLFDPGPAWLNASVAANTPLSSTEQQSVPRRVSAAPAQPYKPAEGTAQCVSQRLVGASSGSRIRRDSM